MQLEPELVGDAVAELDHLAELPRRVDVQQWERQPAGMERLAGQVQHDAAVLADRVQHDRSFELRDDLAHDVDGLGLELLEVGAAQRVESDVTGGGLAHVGVPLGVRRLTGYARTRETSMAVRS